MLKDAKTLEFLFENLVYRDLSVYAEANEGYIRHYRDRFGLECDFVAHFKNGIYGLIEVKLGGFGIPEAKEHLLRLKEVIKEKEGMREPDFMMIITGSNECLKTDDGIYIIPIDCLKD